MSRAQLPRVTLKLATSLDGKIATAYGESRWITGAAAREAVHRMRAKHACVMIGIGTALADDPELTARLEPAPPRQPHRVVIDSEARLRLDSKLAASARENPVHVFVGPRAEAARRNALAARHVHVRTTIQLQAGDLDLSAVLAQLGELDISSVLVEGGGRLAASFIAAGLVDRLEWMRAPIVLGAESVPGIGQLALKSLSSAPRFRRVNVTQLGDDLWETYEM